MVQRTEQWTAIHLIAERIRALCYPAPGTYREFSKLTSITEVEGAHSAMDVVRYLVAAQEATAPTARSIYGLENLMVQWIHCTKNQTGNNAQKPPEKRHDDDPADQKIEGQSVIILCHLRAVKPPLRIDFYAGKAPPAQSAPECAPASLLQAPPWWGGEGLAAPRPAQTV